MEAVRWLSQGEALVPKDDLSWLSARERERLATMRYTKRRGEYLLGRWTAKLALAAVEGMPTEPSALAALEVEPAPDGAPVACLDGQALPHASHQEVFVDYLNEVKRARERIERLEKAIDAGIDCRFR